MGGLPVEGRLPELDGATEWLNSPPLTAAGLRGRVVLVEFWTYTCINWLRTMPWVRAWASGYADDGLVTIGVHTPEFEFEHDRDNVIRAVRELRVPYPVAVDNDYAVWTAFGNHYWPAIYLVDADGLIRHHRFGEGGYRELERDLQRLLGVERELVPGIGEGVEAAADWDTLRSPENYLGYERSENFAGGAVPDQQHGYQVPDRLGRNQWGLSGSWTVGRDRIVAAAAGARIAYRFEARDLHLVMGPGRDPVRYRVLVDGQPAPGLDVDAEGTGTADAQRLYQLVRQPGPVRDRTFEIEFLDPGAEAFVFTFG
jgi:thiol-disulfide isomerase/thioredoxin